MDTNAQTKIDPGAAGVSDLADSERHSNSNGCVPAAQSLKGVALRDESERQVVAANETSALISMIERAARDPNVDIDKMERLWAMKQSADADRARRAYDAAFAEMQEELPEIEKKGKIIIRKKDDSENIIQSTPYALWDDTNRVIKPILTRHGFALSFRITQSESRLTATAVLSHRDGHRETTEFSAPIDATGSKNNVQGWGSSFSYGKRYAATALLNITTRGEDDDGKAAGDLAEPARHTVADLQALIDLGKNTKETTSWLCNHYSVEGLGDLTQKQLAEAISGLRARIKNQKARKS